MKKRAALLAFALIFCISSADIPVQAQKAGASEPEIAAENIGEISTVQMEIGEVSVEKTDGRTIYTEEVTEEIVDEEPDDEELVDGGDIEEADLPDEIRPVQNRINILPDVSQLRAMTQDEISEVYEEIMAISDILDALEEEDVDLSGLNMDRLLAAADFMNQQIMTLDDTVFVTIGDKQYTNFNQALKDVKEGDTIVLQTNFGISGSFVLGYSYSIDLNGHTLSCANTGAGSYIIGVLTGKSLTIKDSSDDKSGKITTTDGSICILSEGTVAVESGSIEGGTGFGIYVGNGGSAVVSGGSVSGTIGIVVPGENSSLKVENGNVTGTNHGIEVSGVGSNVAVCGGTIKGESYYGIAQFGGTVVVQGGEVSGNTGIYSRAYLENRSVDVKIKGGTISGAVYGIVSRDEGPGATVSITGGTISATGNTTGNEAGLCSTGAKTTISEEDGSVTISGPSGIVLFNYVGDDGTKNTGDDISSELTVNAGTITASNGFAISGNNQESAKTKVTINGGTINGEENSAIYWPMEGELTITGGMLIGGTGIEAKLGNIKISGGTITGTGEYTESTPMNGGSSPEGSALLLSAQMYGGNDSYYIESPDLKVEITGGTLVSQKGNAVTVYNCAPDDKANKQNASLTVSGSDTSLQSASGILVKVIAQQDQKVSCEGNSIVTDSGTQTKIQVYNEVSEAIIDTWYNADGTTSYYVNYYEKRTDAEEASENDENAVITGPVARIGDTYYDSLDQAFVNANSSDSIVLLVNIDETVNVTENTKAKLDLNGFSISALINNGTLVILDSSKTGTGTVTGDITNTGTLTLTGGRYDGSLTNTGGKITITGGSFAKDYSSYVISGYTMQSNNESRYTVVPVKTADSSGSNTASGKKKHHRSSEETTDSQSETVSQSVTSAQTGDTTNIIWPLLALLAAVLGIGGYSYFKWKKK